MTLESLEIFVAVARRLSFAAVAAERDVDASSISRAVAALERDLGVRLLQRTTRRMTLTEAGEAYRRRVEAVLDELQAARDEVLADARGPTGTLRLTCSVAFGQTLVLSLLKPLRTRYPQLGVELLMSDVNLDLVAEGIDLAIRLGPPPADSSLVARRLMDTRYRVVASPEYLASAPSLETPADLHRHALLRFPLAGFRSGWRFRDPAGVEETVPVSGQLLISSALGLRTAAVDGLGVALLADWLVDEDLSTGRLVACLENWAVTATEFDTAAWLIYPGRAYLPNKVRVAVDFLRQALGD